MDRWMGGIVKYDVMSCYAISDGICWEMSCYSSVAKPNVLPPGTKEKNYPSSANVYGKYQGHF